jgi:hypothetical protein
MSLPLPVWRRDVLPVASRSECALLPARIVAYNDPVEFRSYDDFTRQEKILCPALGTVFGKPEEYLAFHRGIPGLVRGVLPFAAHDLVFSPDLLKFNRLCDTRHPNNQIKFGYAGHQDSYDRGECWQFAVKICRVNVITKIKLGEPVIYPFVNVRDEKSCPVCYEDLSGNVLQCAVNHSICVKCFHLTPKDGGYRKCAICRGIYSQEECKKADLMKGEIQELDEYFFMTQRGHTTFENRIFNESLFFGVIRFMATHCNFDKFRVMLLSSFFNFWFDNKNKGEVDFSLSINENDDRKFSPSKTNYDVLKALNEYIEQIGSDDNIRDIGYTDIEISNGTMSGSDFLSRLKFLEPESHYAFLEKFPDDDSIRSPIKILRRMTYFKYKLAHSNPSELRQYFKNMFERMLLNVSYFPEQFHLFQLEEND